MGEGIVAGNWAGGAGGCGGLRAACEGLQCRKISDDFWRGIRACSGTGWRAEGGVSRIVKLSLFCVARSTGPSKVRITSTMRAVLMAESLIPQT